MKETSKSRPVRESAGHFDKYLCGHGIDVGCGDDPLVSPGSTIRAWDKGEGDAMYLEGVADKSLDFLYSSHCLEHMVNVPLSLANWRRVVKPGGHLFVVVPDWTLYEQGVWPSQWNDDHKHTFSLTEPRADVGRDNHWHLDDLRSMGGLRLVDHAIEDAGYDHSRRGIDQTRGEALAQIRLVWQRIPT